METETALDRFARNVSEIDHAHDLLEVQREGDVLVFRTSAQSIQKRRRMAWAAGAVGVIAGLALAPITPWAWLLFAFGVGLSVLAPRWIAPQDLLSIDVHRGLFTVTGNSIDSVCFALGPIVTVRGAFESSGWDPYCRVYVTLREGKDVPVLHFPGTDAVVTEYACRILGYLLNCPATYTDAFGKIKECYAPDGAEAAGVSSLHEAAAS